MLSARCPRGDAQSGSGERCGHGQSAVLAEGKEGSGGVTQDARGPLSLHVETWGPEMRWGRDHQLGHALTVSLQGGVKGPFAEL